MTLVDVCGMELYSAVLTTAPFILLALSGSVVFGPVPVAARHRVWKRQRMNMLVDVLALLGVITGAAVSLLVLAGQIYGTSTWRQVVAYAGGLSLLMLTLHVGFDVAARYAEHEKEGAPPTA